jgi:hypothetical protein
MTIRKFMTLSLIFAAALVAIALSSTPRAASQGSAIATLDPVQGLVQRLPVDATNPNAWETVTRAGVVMEGDWIRTGPLGMAYLTFFNGVETEILPDTVVRVARYAEIDPDSQDIIIEVSVGAMHHQIEQALDAQANYEVHTPSAVITVRGTDFWNTGTWQNDTTVPVVAGLLEVAGVDPNGQLSAPVFVNQLQYVTLAPNGQIGPVTNLTGPDDPIIPQHPPEAPLAPETCGNLICDAGEDANNCALDCGSFPNCGNGICEVGAGEGPSTCAVDCVPDQRLGVEPSGTGAPQAAPADTDTGPAPPAEPCTVRTTSASVEIRVGPGTNRGVRDYLPRNQSIDVVGQYTDNSGILWFKIQPPNYNPAEADRYWVRASNVNQSGDCENVPDASASQLVPQKPPPQNTPLPNATSAPGSDFPTMSIAFYADRYNINIGECANIFWDVRGIREVYYQGSAVTGQGSRLECPSTTRTYTLTIITVDGRTLYRTVTITVSSYPY